MTVLPRRPLKNLWTAICSGLPVFMMAISMLEPGCIPSPFYKENKRNLDSLFVNSYAEFVHKNYYYSVTGFREFNMYDSLMNSFESYACLAESYKKLGYPDSAIGVYLEGIQKATDYAKGGQHAGRRSEAYDSLSVWKEGFPSSPKCLNEDENRGRDPCDESPFPFYAPKPSWPESVLNSKVPRTAWLKALLDEDGTVVEVSVMVTGGSDIDLTAIQVFYRWKYTPARYMGKPMRVYVAFPFRYKPSEK